MKLAPLLTIGLSIQAYSSVAAAADYEVCLRLPVTIADESGFEGGVGVSGNWAARGIRIQTLRRNGVPVAGFNGAFADPNTGCFEFSAPWSFGNKDFDIGIKTYGMLGGNNELRVHNDSGVTSYYVNTVSLPGSGGSYDVVWDNEYVLPRMYAIMAYAINNGYRGNYDDETLRVWWHANDTTSGSSPCTCDNVDDTDPTDTWEACTCRVDANDQGHITLPNAQSARKFLLAHEYGHRVVRDSVGDSPFSCGYGSAGHGMRGAEWDSCAAMEGWAHFLATDVWNFGEHSGGDPVGWMRYWGPGNPVLNAESGQGGCATVTADPALNYRSSYADTCFSDVGSFAYDPSCSGGDCTGVSTELDWMRMWWDYHTDGDLPGTRPDHSDLLDEMDAAGGWGITTAWQDLLATITSLDPTQGTRFLQASDINGTSEP